MHLPVRPLDEPDLDAVSVIHQQGNEDVADQEPLLPAVTSATIWSSLGYLLLVAWACDGPPELLIRRAKA